MSPERPPHSALNAQLALPQRVGQTDRKNALKGAELEAPIALYSTRTQCLLSTAIAIAGILIASFVSYFLSYADVIQDTLGRMEAARPDAALGAWDSSQRYNEMVVQLNRSKNLLGFAQAIGGEGSGLALFAAAIQFTLDRIPGRSERKAEA